MDEHKEEGGSVGNQTEPKEEAAEPMKEHGVPVKTETLDAKVDVLAGQPSNGDVDMVEGLDPCVGNSTELASGTVKNPNGGENHGADGLSETGDDTSVRGLEAADGGKDNSVSEKPEEADVGKAEEVGGSVDGMAGDTATPKVEIKNHKIHGMEGAERSANTVEGVMMDVVGNPEIEGTSIVPCGDAERADKTVTLVEVKMTDGMEKPDTKSKNIKVHESTGVEKIINCVGSEVNDEKAKQEVEVNNGDACDTAMNIQTEESQPSAAGRETLLNEGNHTDVESDSGKSQVLAGKKGPATTEIKGGEEKESKEKSEEDNKKMDVECENTIEKGKDKKVSILRDEKRNSESESIHTKPPEHAEAVKENTRATREETAVLAHGGDPVTVSKVGNTCAPAEVSPSAEKCSEEQVRVSDKGEGKTEAMEIDSFDEVLIDPKEELVLKGDTVGGSTENIGDESADANSVQSQEVSIAGADQNNSNTKKKMDIEKKDDEEQKDNDATTGVSAGQIESTGSVERRDVEEKHNDTTRGESAGNIESTGSGERRDVGQQTDKDATTAELNIRIEPTGLAETDGRAEEAATGEVAPLDHNVLFDPNSDIAKFIDFSGELPWSGNTQEVKAETTDVPVKGGTNVTDKTQEVTTVDEHQGVRPDVQLQGSVENVQESLLEEPKGEGANANTTSCNPDTVDEMQIEQKVTDSENLSPMEIDRKVSDTENLSIGLEGTEKNSVETHVVAGPESSVPTADDPQEASDANLAERQQEEKVQEHLGKRTEKQEGRREEQECDAHEAPSNLEQDSKMEEKQQDAENFDGTDSDTKTNELKRKADALNEDSSQARKTISVAKVSSTPPHHQKPSFKIGECIARAASQMAGSPSALKGSSFSEENLSVENFLTQLYSAATEPAKENNVSEIAAGFFLDYRNTLVSHQFAADKVSGKRGRPSNSNTGGAEAFEFDEMSDTYWTDRVIHNGGEEQTPSGEKADYQIVPVELKPAQVQRSRRPYTKRRHSDHSNNSHSVPDKPVGIDENSPAELIMNFSETDTIPSEINLNKMFRHFGPIRESQTEVDGDNCRARVVFKKCADAEVAFNSAGRFNIFGTKIVNYELSYTITEPFKVQPYVVTLGEEDAALCVPSQS